MTRPDVFHAQSQPLVPYPSSKKESSEIRVCVLTTFDPYIATRGCPRGNMRQSNPKNMAQVSTSGATRLIFTSEVRAPSLQLDLNATPPKNFF